jgi:hypothetical protein
MGMVQKSGFLPTREKQSFPPNLMTSFTSESDENLKQYLGGTKELTWLHKKVKAGDFLQFNEGFFIRDSSPNLIPLTKFRILQTFRER